MGIVPENRLARHFRDIAGRVNQRLAAAADAVWLVVSGIGVKSNTQSLADRASPGRDSVCKI